MYFTKNTEFQMDPFFGRKKYKDIFSTVSSFRDFKMICNH